MLRCRKKFVSVCYWLAFCMKLSEARDGLRASHGRKSRTSMMTWLRLLYLESGRSYLEASAFPLVCP